MSDPRTVTVGPRIEFDTEGYVRLRVWDPDAPGDRYVYLQRLVALAFGELDSLDDPRHAHHINGDRWDNRPSNIEAREPSEHGRHHGPQAAD